MCIPICVPQPYEQDKISNWIYDNTQILTHSIEHTKKEVSLLQEYRTSLIADVVTGKLDVRIAAAQLPKEFAEIETIEEETDEEDVNFEESDEEVTEGEE